MKLTIKTCDKEILIETDMVQFSMGDKGMCRAVVPYGDYPNAERLNPQLHDLFLVRIETTALNTEGYARILDIYPVEIGSLLSIRFDRNVDIN